MRNPYSSLSVPDPTPAFFLVAIAAVLVWVVGDAGWLSLLIVGVAVAPCVLYLLVILPYFFLRVFLTSDWRFRKALEIVLLAGVMEAAYALLCFYSNRFFGTTFGMEQDQYGIIPGTYGTQLEANILGSTSAACLVMLLTLYFKERKAKFLAGAAITYAGMAVSLSRAAVLAAGVASLVVILYYWKKKVVTAQMLTRV